MGMFSGKDDNEIFTPDCRVDTGASNQGRAILVCQPTLKKDGKVIGGSRPTQLIIEEGQQARIIDDGGAPESVLARLIKNVEEQRLQ